MLADGDHEMIRRMLAWLNRCEDPLCATMLEELGQRGLVASSDLQTNLRAESADARAASAATLYRSWKVEEGLVSLQTLNRLLRGSAAERRAGVRGLGLCGQPRYVHVLVPLLHSADAETGARPSMPSPVWPAGIHASSSCHIAGCAGGNGGGTRARAGRSAQDRRSGLHRPAARRLHRLFPRELREAEGVLRAIDQARRAGHRLVFAGRQPALFRARARSTCPGPHLLRAVRIRVSGPD